MWAFDLWSFPARCEVSEIRDLSGSDDRLARSASPLFQAKPRTIWQRPRIMRRQGRILARKLSPTASLR